MISKKTSGWLAGTVAPNDEYESLRDELISKLRSIRDPASGQVTNSRVLKKEDIYEGDFLDQAPDLYLEVENYRVAEFPNIRNTEDLLSPLILASHYLEVILFARGPDVKQDQTMKGVRLIDLVPTILHIKGVPVPEDMDGCVLRRCSRLTLFSQGRAASRRPHCVTGIRVRMTMRKKTRCGNVLRNWDICESENELY